MPLPSTPAVPTIIEVNSLASIVSSVQIGVAEGCGLIKLSNITLFSPILMFSNDSIVIVIRESLKPKSLRRLIFTVGAAAASIGSTPSNLPGSSINPSNMNFFNDDARPER